MFCCSKHSIPLPPPVEVRLSAQYEPDSPGSLDISPPLAWLVRNLHSAADASYCPGKSGRGSAKCNDDIRPLRKCGPENPACSKNDVPDNNLATLRDL